MPGRICLCACGLLCVPNQEVRGQGGRARPRLNGDEGSARRDKTRSITRVIPCPSETTMFWIGPRKSSSLVTPTNKKDGISRLFLLVGKVGLCLATSYVSRTKRFSRLHISRHRSDTSTRAYSLRCIQPRTYIGIADAESQALTSE